MAKPEANQKMQPGKITIEAIDKEIANVKRQQKETIPRLIVAGNYVQFRDFMRERGLNTIYHKYIAQAEQLHGIAPGTSIALVGTYRNRDDWTDLHLHITSRKLKVARYGDE